MRPAVFIRVTEHHIDVQADANVLLVTVDERTNPPTARAQRAETGVGRYVDLQIRTFPGEGVAS